MHWSRHILSFWDFLGKVFSPSPGGLWEDCAWHRQWRARFSEADLRQILGGRHRWMGWLDVEVFFRIWSDVNDVNNDWYWMILVCLIVSVNLHNMWRPRSMTLMTHYQTSIWTYINIYQRSFILTYQISSNLCLLIYQMNLKDPPPAFQKLMAEFWACIFVARRFRGTGTMWIWIRICMCKACSKSCSIVLQILCMTWKYGFI